MMSTEIIDKKKFKNLKLFKADNCKNDKIVAAFENVVNKRKAEVEKFDEISKRIKFNKEANEEESKIKKISSPDKNATTNKINNFFHKMINYTPNFQQRTIEFSDNYRQPTMQYYIKTSDNISCRDLRVRKYPFISDDKPGSVAKIADNLDSSMLQEIVLECMKDQQLEKNDIISALSSAIDGKSKIRESFKIICEEAKEVHQFCRRCFIYGCAKNHHQIEEASTNANKEDVYTIYPCSHDGPCNYESGCLCFTQNYHCETFCNCEKSECKNSFRGCNCKGECVVSCSCRISKRECVFGVCQCKVKYNVGRREITGLRCKNSDNQMKRDKSLIIKPSTIPGIGWGVFAQEKIKIGDYIGEYTGEILHMKESDARGKYYEKIGLTFQFTLTKQHVVDANRFGSIMKFVNNGVQEASNNIRPIIMTVNGERKICFYAIKNIEINDELFFDYQWDKKTQDKFFKVKTGNK